MSQTPSVPYPLNPNLSCVERVRVLFREIIKRRLISTARVRPDQYEDIQEWIIDTQFNTLPVMMLNKETLASVWNDIAPKAPVREFLFGLCFEVRQRCFEDETDYRAYLETITQSVVQFDDQLSVIGDDYLDAVGSAKEVGELLAGNAWVIPILLLEQLEPDEIGLAIAQSTKDSQKEAQNA